MNPAIKIYDNEQSVIEHLKLKGLHPSEKTILRKVAEMPIERRKSMLDLGVGTGRTTPFFAPLFENYMGVDIADAMVESCKNQFKGNDKMKFITADASELIQSYSPEIFDFIFFPAQGMGFFDNIQAIETFLGDVFRVLKKDGLFAFSLPNARGIEKLYRFQFPKNPFNFLPEYKRWTDLKIRNGSLDQYKGKDHFKINNDTIFATADLMVLLLSKSGFRIITLYNNKGKFISNSPKCEDHHIHYVCYK